MKKFYFLLLATFIFSISFVKAESFDYVKDGQQITYNIYKDFWTVGGVNEDDVVLYKKLYEGAGSCSQYLDSDNKIIFTLTTDLEFVKDGVLYAINNDEFKYYKIIYNGEEFKEIPLTYNEIKELFFYIDVIDLALIDDDNKMWIHKPIGEKKKILFINNGKNYFHKLTPKCKNIQDENIKGLITISRYGIYNFTHFGKRDGKLTIYVR